MIGLIKSNKHKKKSCAKMTKISVWYKTANMLKMKLFVFTL